MTRMRVMDVLEKGCRISSLNIYPDAVFNIRYLWERKKTTLQKKNKLKKIRIHLLASRAVAEEPKVLSREYSRERTRYMRVCVCDTTLCVLVAF
jgi:hypothetical protein